MTSEELQPFFASDLAAEVRREFDVRVSHGVPAADATRDVLQLFAGLLSDPNEGPVIFIALAAAQLCDGHVVPAVRDAAIELIESGEARRAYANGDSTMGKQRKQLLADLKEALESPSSNLTDAADD